jgi:hypothetical protein
MTSLENNLDDPKNIAGLSSLVNDDDLDSNFDISDLEREIANGAVITQEEEVSFADNYKKDMERLSRNYDMGMVVNETQDDLVSIKSVSPTNSVRSFKQTNNYDNRPEPNADSFRRSSVDEHHDDHADYDDSWNKPPQDSQLRRMTDEEKKQNRINNVLHDIDDRELEFNIEKEKEEDDKSSLLEQIDMLRITLEDDGVDVSGVPIINKNSSTKDIQNVYKILRLKNDRNRYCSFAEEIILAGAYGLEYLFDGKKEWFNRKPDLVGWPDTVKVKLRRMRYETSTFVQEVMQEYNMSAGTRLMLELVPSMFLYSRSRRLSQNDNLVSDSQYKDAISQLNSLE